MARNEYSQIYAFTHVSLGFTYTTLDVSNPQVVLFWTLSVHLHCNWKNGTWNSTASPWQLCCHVHSIPPKRAEPVSGWNQCWAGLLSQHFRCSCGWTPDWCLSFITTLSYSLVSLKDHLCSLSCYCHFISMAAFSSCCQCVIFSPQNPIMRSTALILLLMGIISQLLGKTLTSGYMTPIQSRYTIDYHVQHFGIHTWESPFCCHCLSFFIALYESEFM